MKNFLLLLMCSVSVTTYSHSFHPDKSWLIIFLDIDGVLYREPTRDDFREERREKMVGMFGVLDRYWSFHYDSATAYYFNPNAVALLENFIHQATLRHNVGIVISSAWREGHTLEELRQIFSPWSFSEFIIDKTVPSSYSGYTKEERQGFLYSFPLRGDQINHWLLNSTLPIEYFVIFDDQDSGLSHRFPNQFIQIKTPYFASEHIQVANEIIDAQKGSPLQ